MTKKQAYEIAEEFYKEYSCFSFGDHLLVTRLCGYLKHQYRDCKLH